METVRDDRPRPATERASPTAARLCLVGVFLHMTISGPLLYSLGFNYATLGSLSDEGAFYDKIHPGTYFIYLSLAVLLWSRRDPLGHAFAVYRRNKVALFLLIYYVLALAYMVARSGPGGLAFLVDTQMTAVIGAVVLGYAPGNMCRSAINLFILFAAINGAIGIAEAAGKFRLIEYRDEWPVLHEDTFRASALEGHPLANALLTSLALFTALGMRSSAAAKVGLVALFLTALVAFGGRAGLAVSLLSLAAWAVPAVIRTYRERRSLARVLVVTAALFAAPAAVAVGLYAAVNSGLGERLAAHSYWDESADARRSAFRVLGYMNDEELILGVSADRIGKIVDRLGATTGAMGIENPWLIMFMNLGGFAFAGWLALTAAFVGTLMRRVPLNLKLVALNYFVIASTFVSFGTKEPMYGVMVFAVVCGSRAMAAPAGAMPGVAPPRPLAAGAA